jgi:hypothetical protein
MVASCHPILEQHKCQTATPPVGTPVAVVELKQAAIV